MPFDQSPPVVSKAKLLIEERVKNALGLVIEFNEVLSVAYVEEQGMSVRDFPASTTFPSI